jgi:pyocin large subunit-like protein
MPLQTKGFPNERQKERHFSLHGDGFGTSNAQEYEELADVFLAGATRSGCLQGVRKNGELVRYDPATECFGVIDRRGVILTFYKPVPCVSIMLSSDRDQVRRSGKCHGFATNLLYFQSECAK